MSLEFINFNETASSNDVCHRKADIMETSFMFVQRTFHSHLLPIYDAYWWPQFTFIFKICWHAADQEAKMFRCFYCTLCIASLKIGNKFLSISNYNFISSLQMLILFCAVFYDEDLRRRCTIAFYEFDCSISLVIKH